MLWPGHTPPITDAAGRVIPGSVATLEQVPIHGTRQWILMRGYSEQLPVLLFLSGGPGGTERGWVRAHNAELEKHFVVAVWEQPGVGKSYPLAWTHREQLTLDQYVKDGVALAESLRRRFGQDKIFLMGHSWGSILGVWMAQRRPDLFHAYIGVGQMTSTLQDDQLGYRYVLDRARAEGNTELVGKLERQGPPPYSGSLTLPRYMTYLNPLTSYEHGLIRQAGGVAAAPSARW